MSTAHERLAERVGADVVDSVPDAWLGTHGRDAYRTWLAERLAWGGSAREAEDAR